MRLQWPAALVFALVVPAFLWFCVRIERQRRAAARSHVSMYAHATGLADRRPFVRRLPLALFLASLVAICAGLARPQVSHAIFALKGTVVLAVDVSVSMKADDERPHRLALAQAQARVLVERYADDYKIGLVSFGANAVAELEPTTDREALFAAIDRLIPRPGTTVGGGISAALAMLFPHAGIDTGPWDAHYVPAPAARHDAGEPRRASHAAAAIVLISDGQSAGGPEPLEAARLAAGFGVPVHTIGVGSAEGRTMRLEGWTMRVQLDEVTLREVAKLTGGEYFRASDAVVWSRIVDTIRPEPPKLESYTEVTALFAGVAAVAAICSALLSLVWNKRVL